MKKRLTGVLAIIIAFCVAFSGLPFLAGNLEANALAKKKKLPKNITLQVVASGQTQAVLRWNKIKSPSKGYAVFRDGEPVKHFNTKKITFTDNELKAGTSYTYQIKTYTKKTVKMWFNKKTEKWQKKKPAKKYRGKSKNVTVYTYKKKSNAVTIHTASAPAPSTPSDTGDNGGSDDSSTAEDTKKEEPSKDTSDSSTAEDTKKEEPSKETTDSSTTDEAKKEEPSNDNSDSTSDAKAEVFTITWVVGDKSSTTTVNAGDVPVYNGTPTKPTANGKAYTFTGWSPTPVAATGNKTYTAQFSETNVSPAGFTYDIHFLTEPYGNYGTERMANPVYIETNNSNGIDYPQGYTYTIKNPSGKIIDFFPLYHYYTGGDRSRHIDFNISSIPTGAVFLFCTSYSGPATVEVYEYDDNMQKTLVASKQVTIRDYNAEEQAWVQSVINEATDSSMTNSEKMFAICKYISEDLGFRYTKVDKNNPTKGYLSILADEGKPYWVTKRANSYVSPTFLEEFGKALGYPLHNCYNDYEEGSAEWEHIHYYVYSEADGLYFEACPATSTGYTDVSSIEQIDLSTYQFWGE